MPFHKDPMSTGNLYIEFLIEFPKKGELKNVEDLKKLLPAVKEVLPIDKNIQEFLEDFDETSVHPDANGSRKKDEDDDEEEGGQRVHATNCQQQ